eukprot:3002445-Ditylum_brightwellii.AAC.1
MNTLEDDGTPSNDNMSNQNSCLYTISETTSINKDEFYQTSDVEAKDNTNWSNYKVDRDDDYGLYNDKSHAFAESYSMLSDEATEGEDSIIFSGPPKDLETYFGP